MNWIGDGCVEAPVSPVGAATACQFHCLRQEEPPKAPVGFVVASLLLDSSFLRKGYQHHVDGAHADHANASGMHCAGVCVSQQHLQGFLNSLKRTEIDRFSFQNGLALLFCGSIFCLWFSLSLAVVTPGLGFLHAAYCKGMLNSHRVASVATQGASPKWQAQACSITPASYKETVAIQPNN